MSNLDDKLREILLGESVKDIEPSDIRQLRVKKVDEKIVLIKQAFAEEIMPLVDGMNEAAQRIVDLAFLPIDPKYELNGDFRP